MSRKIEGELMRRMREVAKLSIDDMEAQTGIPEGIMVALEGGENVRDAIVKRVMEFLELSLDARQGKLLPGAEEAIKGGKGKRKARGTGKEK